MTEPDEPADPLQPRFDFPYAAALRHGRLFYQQLTECGHLDEAEQTIGILGEKQLKALALYVAAEAQMLEVERTGDPEVWNRWWRGVDSTDEDTIEVTPTALRNIMRPVEDVD